MAGHQAQLHDGNGGQRVHGMDSADGHGNPLPAILCVSISRMAAVCQMCVRHGLSRSGMVFSVPADLSDYACMHLADDT